MKIVSAKYLKGFTNIKDIDVPTLPSVAFIGRSNVGKSSLINHLLNRKRLVKTSSTPGKTQLINYFIINERFYFIDLPGYGYANVPVRVKNSWMKMITDFLFHYPGLKLIILLIDARHKPSKNDIEFKKLLDNGAIPTLTIANKSDKLKRSQIHKAQQDVTSVLELTNPPIYHSIFNKKDPLSIWRHLETYLKM